MSFKFPTVLETKLALYATWIRYEEIYENQWKDRKCDLFIYHY
jgi:hypothetical protein